MREARVNILGCELIFNEKTCQSYNDIPKMIANTAPEKIINELNKLPQDKFVDLMISIWLELVDKLSLPKVDQGLNWDKALANYKPKQ